MTPRLKIITIPAALFLTALLCIFAAIPADNKDLAALLSGNKRYADGKMLHPDLSIDRRTAISAAQHPFAVVVCCSDSRVPPELVFDQGLGDLFVIRTAGNLVDSIAVGSIEYAVEHLDVHLIVVLGHENCGVIKAFLEGGAPHGHIRKLTEAVAAEPEIQLAMKAQGDKTDACVRANIHHITQLLRNNQWGSKGAAQLTIVGARYDLDSGKVEVIE